jgi:hypothetical protein
MPPRNAHAHAHYEDPVDGYGQKTFRSVSVPFCDSHLNDLNTNTLAL